MNTYYISDESFKNSNMYKDYLKENPSTGFLKIRAYTANEAVPVKGVNIIISKIINDSKIIFFEGFTDTSGIIDKILLPAPKLDNNNLKAPNYTKYEITAIFNNNIKNYTINMYENIYVTQTINITPNMNMGDFVGY